MIDENGTRVRLSDKMTYVGPPVSETDARTWAAQYAAHEARMRLVNAPFPPIMTGRVLPSAMVWSGVLFYGAGARQTDEDAKRGRRVQTRGPSGYDQADWTNKVSYYADRTTD